MAIHISFPKLSHVALFLLVKIILNGSKAQSCPITEAVADLTETKADLSENVEKEVNIYSPNSTLSQNGKKLGCPCRFKTCVSLCCDLGFARLEGICVKDNYTSGILPKIITFNDNDNEVEEDILGQNYHPFTNDPCVIGWMSSSIMKNVSLLKNGSIFTPDFSKGPISDLDQYCLMREPNSIEYVAKVCRPWIRKGAYEVYCVNIAILILLVILVIYTKVYQQRNLHGMIFRSYIATYIMIYVFALGVMFTTELRINPFWFTFTELTARYFCGCCSFWLTVMSFNIWRSFRDIRPICCNVEAQRRKRFIRYAIYSWITPIFLLGIVILVIKYVPYFYKDPVGRHLKQWGSVATITFVLVCNTVLYTSTALSIRKQKKDTAQIVDSVNNHRDIDRQWFNLYLKLFFIMGAHIVVWPIYLVWPTPAMMRVLSTTEVLQSILIFVIFVWNDNVKRSIHQKCHISCVSDSIKQMQPVNLHARMNIREENGVRSYEVELIYNTNKL